MDLMSEHRHFETSLQTFERVRRELRKVGMTIQHNDGEYRVNFKGGKEKTAYYTDCVLDALHTGEQMALRFGL